MFFAVLSQNLKRNAKEIISREIMQMTGCRLGVYFFVEAALASRSSIGVTCQRRQHWCCCCCLQLGLSPFLRHLKVYCDETYTITSIPVPVSFPVYGLTMIYIPCYVEHSQIYIYPLHLSQFLIG